MSLYDDMKAAGLVVAHHETDLYVRNTAETRAILTRYPEHARHASGFRDNVTGQPCLEIPFAYPREQQT